MHYAPPVHIFLSIAAAVTAEAVDITLLRSENRALIDILVGLKMETAMLRTADDELRHQLRASRATSAALMDVSSKVLLTNVLFPSRKHASVSYQLVVHPHLHTRSNTQHRQTTWKSTLTLLFNSVEL